MEAAKFENGGFASRDKQKKKPNWPAYKVFSDLMGKQ